MKKSTLIILLTACVLIVAGLVICGIAVARGADIRQMARDGDFNLGISVVDGQFGGNSGYTVCENGEAAFPAAAVSRLDIGWVAGSVEISSYDGDKIQVTESASRALEENEKLRWKLEDGVLHLRYCAPGLCNMQAKSLTVLIPESLCLEGLEVDVTAAELTLDALTVSGEVNFDSVSGDLDCDFPSLKGVYGGEDRFEMDISTTSGDLNIRKN